MLRGQVGVGADEPLDTPEALAERHLDVEEIDVETIMGDTVGVMAGGIRARDKQIAAKVRRLAEAAEREAAAHPSPERVARCEGQASAFCAIAAMLEGPRDAGDVAELGGASR